MLHLKLPPQRSRQILLECSIGSVRRRLFGPLVLAAALFPASAQAAPVVVLGPGGRAAHRNDPLLTLPASLPATRPHAIAHGVRGHVARSSGRTVSSELARLLRIHAISSAAYHRYAGSLAAAEAALRRLGGTRASELGAVLQNLHNIAVAGALTPSRLPALFLTLDRNRQWWTSGPLLSSGQYVEFAHSQLVWEYYGGQGIELQPLATFGKADGFYTGGPSD